MPGTPCKLLLVLLIHCVLSNLWTIYIIILPNSPPRDPLLTSGLLDCTIIATTSGPPKSSLLMEVVSYRRWSLNGGGHLMEIV